MVTHVLAFNWPRNDNGATEQGLDVDARFRTYCVPPHRQQSTPLTESELLNR